MRVFISIKLQRVVFVHEELDGPGVDVADPAHRRLQQIAHLGAQFRGHLHRWRFLNQLLMPPLNAAFALAQAHHVAEGVGQHLELDVPRALDVFFHVECAVAEGSSRFALRGVEQLRQLFLASE